MARNPANRIEVDLKLLQDRNIERLQQFGQQFDKSISTLATLVGSFSEQIQGARGINAPGKPGPDASMAPTRIEPARMGGTSTGGGGFTGGFANGGRGGYGSGDASIAPTSPLPSPSAAGQDEFERQYIEATKRIGEIPVGPRQALGYAAAGQFKIPGMSQETAKKWNTALFNMQAYKANMMLGIGKVQGFFGSQQARTALGQQLGRSREGGFLGIGSSAWKTGFLETLKTGVAADFGFNPYYSLQQAQQARQTLQSYGYSGDTSDRLASMLKDLQIHQGLDPASSMSVLDPFMRFGGTENLGQLTSILKSIPNAAYAAKMNLAEFTKELISTAQQVAQTTGMTVGNAARGLSSFSAVTGLSPSRAGGIMSDPTAAWMAVGLTHSNLWDVTNGPHALSSRYKIFQDRFTQVTHTSAAQLLHLARTNHEAFATVMSRAQALYMQDPNFFGGLSPREWWNSQLRNQGHTVGHIAIQESMATAGSDRQMDHLLKAWGGPAGRNMSHQFEIWEAKHPLSAAKSPATHARAARAFAEALLKDQERRSATRAGRQITIGLTNEAKKYFKVNMDDTPQRNSIGATARSAMGTAEHVIGDITNPEKGISDIFHAIF